MGKTMNRGESTGMMSRRSKKQKPAVVEADSVEPAVVEADSVEPAVVEPASVEPAVVEPAVVEPVVEPASDEATLWLTEETLLVRESYVAAEVVAAEVVAVEVVAAEVVAAEVAEVTIQGQLIATMEELQANKAEIEELKATNLEQLKVQKELELKLEFKIREAAKKRASRKGVPTPRAEHSATQQAMLRMFKASLTADEMKYGVVYLKDIQEMVEYVEYQEHFVEGLTMKKVPKPNAVELAEMVAAGGPFFADFVAVLAKGVVACGTVGISPETVLTQDGMAKTVRKLFEAKNGAASLKKLWALGGDICPTLFAGQFVSVPAGETVPKKMGSSEVLNACVYALGKVWVYYNRALRAGERTGEAAKAAKEAAKEAAETLAALSTEDTMMDDA